MFTRSYPIRIQLCRFHGSDLAKIRPSSRPCIHSETKASATAHPIELGHSAWFPFHPNSQAAVSKEHSQWTQIVSLCSNPRCQLWAGAVLGSACYLKQLRDQALWWACKCSPVFRTVHWPEAACRPRGPTSNSEVCKQKLHSSQHPRPYRFPNPASALARSDILHTAHRHMDCFAANCIRSACRKVSSIDFVHVICRQTSFSKLAPRSCALPLSRHYHFQSLWRV